MTNKQIIKKAIEKVVNLGYDVELGVRGDIVKIFNGKDETKQMPSIREFIFYHDFAKAFFYGFASGWKYHLQQMVIEDDPIQYLGRYL